MSKKKNRGHYIDKIPMINLAWEETDDGLVEVTVENKGFYHFLAQKIFHKPRYSFIKLDDYGSFVWKQIDGTKSIYEIGQILNKERKGASHQLYERLVKFFVILEQHHYIQYKKENGRDQA